jgi:hypothetical protein
MNTRDRDNISETRDTQLGAVSDKTTGRLVNCFAIVHCLGGFYDEDGSRLVADW